MVALRVDRPGHAGPLVGLHRRCVDVVTQHRLIRPVGADSEGIEQFRAGECQGGLARHVGHDCRQQVRGPVAVGEMGPWFGVQPLTCRIQSGLLHMASCKRGSPPVPSQSPATPDVILSNCLTVTAPKRGRRPWEAGRPAALPRSGPGS